MFVFALHGQLIGLDLSSDAFELAQILLQGLNLIFRTSEFTGNRFASTDRLTECIARDAVHLRRDGGRWHLLLLGRVKRVVIGREKQLHRRIDRDHRIVHDALKEILQAWNGEEKE